MDASSYFYLKIIFRNDDISVDEIIGMIISSSKKFSGKVKLDTHILKKLVENIDYNKEGIKSILVSYIEYTPETLAVLPNEIKKFLVLA